ncbi:MAG: hypothetical protein AB7O78_09115 [Thermoleophilia bacterium]
MRQAPWRSLLVAGVAAIPLLSGCAILQPGGNGSGGLGTTLPRLSICASGPGSNQCADKGAINLDATSGLRQLLLGVQIPADVGAPATIVTDPPEAVTFTSSPGYTAELQRLQPAPNGRKWVGWISPALNYSTDNGLPQRLSLGPAFVLPHAADGSPSTADTLATNWVVGIRNLTSVALPERPVACGDSLTTAVKDFDHPTQPGFTYCADSQIAMSTPSGFDYGVVATGARASGLPGTVVTMPFILRNGRVGSFGPIPVRASTTLPGATAAVTPEKLSPPVLGDASGLVAVGIPAGAAPGTYDVTFTADFGGGVTRVGVGKLTVLPLPAGAGGPAGGGSRTPAKRKLTTILPKGLPIATALASGVPVLLGSNVAGPALVRFQQGPKRKPVVSVGKRIRLKAPGPVKVTFRSRKLVKGPFRVTVSIAGKVVKTAGGRLAK